MKFLPFALVATAFSHHLATAAVVNIDFTSSVSSGYTGLGAAPDLAANTFWNAATNSGSSVTVSDLRDSTNTPTLVDFSLSGIESSVNPSSSNMERSGGTGTGYDPLMRDYLRIDSGDTSGVVVSVNGTFSGLVVGGSYDLYFYGQGEIMGTSGAASIYRGQNSLFTVNGISKQTGWDGVASGNNVLTEGIEFVKFSATADSNGEINFQWANVVAANPNTGATGNVAANSDAAPNGQPASSNSNSRFAALNGVQLVSTVPEPSSALLGMLGMAGLLVRRRR